MGSNADNMAQTVRQGHIKAELKLRACLLFFQYGTNEVGLRLRTHRSGSRAGIRRTGRGEAGTGKS